MNSRPHFSRLYHAGPTSREHELSRDATNARPHLRFVSTLFLDDDDASRASTIASAFRGALRRFEGHRDPALEAKDDCHPASSHEEDTRPPPARFTATADDSSTSSEETIIFTSSLQDGHHSPRPLRTPSVEDTPPSCEQRRGRVSYPCRRRSERTRVFTIGRCRS